MSLITTSAQMKEIENRAVDEYSLTYLLMMESAGEAVYNEIEKRYGNVAGKSFLVLCGSGNNGGDGLVTARHLHYNRAVVKVYLPSGEQNLNENCKRIVSRLPKGSFTTDISGDELDGYDFIIDAIYGTGFHGTLDDSLNNIFAKANLSNAVKIAVDLVSGTVCDSGQTGGNCIKCDITVTFCLPKLCHFLFPAAAYKGELVICDIGIPEKAVLAQNIKTEIVTSGHVDKVMPKRSRNTHKGDYGKLLSICGSKYMTGAAALSSSGALKSGVGILNLMVPDEILSIMQTKLTEPVFDSFDGLNIEEKLVPAVGKNDAVLFGCGCGESDTTLKILKMLLISKLPIVLDADALNIAAKNKISFNRKPKTVITPHTIEFSRLSGLSPEQIESDRINAAARYSEKENVITVLKGAYTIIAEPFGRVFINPFGNAGMATGGSGDVLSGIIASFIAQGIDAFDAAVLGVYFHSLAGDAAALKISQYGMTPTDLLNELPLLFKKYDGA